MAEIVMKYLIKIPFSQTVRNKCQYPKLRIVIDATLSPLKSSCIYVVNDIFDTTCCGYKPIFVQTETLQNWRCGLWSHVCLLLLCSKLCFFLALKPLFHFNQVIFQGLITLLKHSSTRWQRITSVVKALCTRGSTRTLWKRDRVQW